MHLFNHKFCASYTEGLRFNSDLGWKAVVLQWKGRFSDFLPPAYGVCGKVMFSVVSVCPQGVSPRSVQTCSLGAPGPSIHMGTPNPGYPYAPHPNMSKLVHLGDSLGPTRHVQTCSLVAITSPTSVDKWSVGLRLNGHLGILKYKWLTCC